MPDAPSTSPHPPFAPAGAFGWRQALFVAATALLVYGGTALLTGNTSSPNVAYFDHLARAFLDGHLYLEDPPGESDLTLYDGRWYVPFLPLPAVLMLPWVAAFGVAHTNTVLFSVIVGTLNVVVVGCILDALARRGWIALRRADRWWLLLLFALGCVHWQVATEGSVWFLSQTCTVLFIGLAVWAAIATGAPWLAATALAIALWGRPTVIFTWPFLLGIFLQQVHDQGGRIDRRRLTAWIWRSLVPVAISIAGLAAYNYARFGRPFDFGYGTQNVSAELVGELARGQFAPYHIPRNLHVLLMGAPRWYEPEFAPWLHLPVPDAHGMSIFLTTPALFYLVRAWRRREPLVRSAWISVGLLLIPLLLYYNTGWRQWGYRFSLDFMIPVMVLLAVAAGTRITRPMHGLILLGVLVNTWGVAWWYTSWLD